MDNQEDKNVWIDRQEYERLKALEAQPQPTPAAASGDVAPTTATQTFEGEPAKTSVSMLTILTGVSACLSFIYPPLVMVFLGLGIASMVRFFRGRTHGKMSIGLSLAIGLGAGLVLLMASPFILFIAFFIMWQVGCWTGLGSCTTA